MLLSQNEYEIIQNQAEWSDQLNTFMLPMFYFKQKKIHFPKLPRH